MDSFADQYCVKPFKTLSIEQHLRTAPENAFSFSIANPSDTLPRVLCTTRSLLLPRIARKNITAISSSFLQQSLHHHHSCCVAAPINMPQPNTTRTSSRKRSRPASDDQPQSENKRAAPRTHRIEHGAPAGTSTAAAPRTSKRTTSRAQGSNTAKDTAPVQKMKKQQRTKQQPNNAGGGDAQGQKNDKGKQQRQKKDVRQQNNKGKNKEQEDDNGGAGESSQGGSDVDAAPKRLRNGMLETPYSKYVLQAQRQLTTIAYVGGWVYGCVGAWVDECMCVCACVCVCVCAMASQPCIHVSTSHPHTLLTTTSPPHTHTHLTPTYPPHTHTHISHTHIVVSYRCLRRMKGMGGRVSIRKSLNPKLR